MSSISIPSNRKFPLRKIFLRNFKSVKDSEVTISPLTVVVGANSSGKSTLLQSILSLSQAISKDLNGTAYPLNGEKIRLGSFAETKSFFVGDSDESIQIGFEIEAQIKSYQSGDRYRQRRTRSDGSRFNYRVIFKFDLVKSGSEDSGTAQVERILIESERTDEGGSIAPPHLMKVDLNFDPDFENEDQRGIFYGKSASGTVYNSESSKTHSVSRARFNGLIPVEMYEEGDNAVFAAEQIFKAITEVLADEFNIEKKRLGIRPLSDRELLEIEESAVEVVCPILGDLEDNWIPYSDENGDFVQGYVNDDKSLQTEIRQLKPKEKSKLAALVACSNIERTAAELDRSSDMPFLVKGVAWRPIREGVSDSSEDLASLAKRLFRFKTNYLGPIRLMPKVNYDPSSGRPDVGPTGEYTAYVLHAMGKQNFTFPLPNGSSRSVSLNEAVNLWLEFFGLASGVKTTDNGRLGIGLRLNLLNGNHEVDLTSVGVGVSQALPVVVSCLMAKTGTILLIEQPELHLHPKLQMDLADFFIACCKSGRQIIIETHSEHMINRLRRRIAENDNGELEELIGILFVEQKNGVTQYRSPSINKFGGLGSDWPDGFLDIGAGEMENLLGAGLAKRKKNLS